MIKQKNNTLIIVFTRNPELGKVKTRLAKGIGNKNALEVYKILLKHTDTVLRKTNIDKLISYSVKINKDDIWDNTMYMKEAQKGTHLGERMQNAFTNAFKHNYEKVIVIGSDLYDLNAMHIEKAIEALNSNDLVMGPAKDGGYYLLGMKTLHQTIFKNKNWGTNTVFQETLKDLEDIEDLKIEFLETLNDIDFAEDLETYPIFKPYL